jgi:hypothetical protein
VLRECVLLLASNSAAVVLPVLRILVEGRQRHAPPQVQIFGTHGAHLHLPGVSGMRS